MEDPVPEDSPGTGLQPARDRLRACGSLIDAVALEIATGSADHLDGTRFPDQPPAPPPRHVRSGDCRSSGGRRRHCRSTLGPGSTEAARGPSRRRLPRGARSGPSRRAQARPLWMRPHVGAVETAWPTALDRAPGHRCSAAVPPRDAHHRGPAASRHQGPARPDRPRHWVVSTSRRPRVGRPSASESKRRRQLVRGPHTSTKGAPSAGPICQVAALYAADSLASPCPSTAKVSK